MVSFDSLELYPRAVGGFRFQQINVENEKSDIAADGSGLIAIDRASATGWTTYQNGAAFSTQTVSSTGVPNSTIKFVGKNFSGNVSAGFIGQKLSPAEHLALYTATKTYLDGVGAPTQTADQLLNPASLTKAAGAFVTSFLESTIGLAPDGTPIVITFTHDPSPPRFEVRNLAGTLLANKTWVGGGDAGTWIVVGGVIHIFGTTFDGLRIVHSTLDASYNPSAASTIYTVGDAVTLANIGITASPAGYVMDVERPFAADTVFLSAATIDGAWSAFGSPFIPGGYLGSPKIHFLDGIYYLTYLVNREGAFYTTIAKSTNALASFTISTAGIGNTAAIIYPDVPSGKNASDWVAVDDGLGNIQAVWIDGNQDTTGDVRRATYSGITLSQLFASFFP